MMMMVSRENIYLGAINTEKQAGYYYDVVAIASQGISAKTNYSYSISQVRQIFDMFENSDPIIPFG